MLKNKSEHKKTNFEQLVSFKQLQCCFVLSGHNAVAHFLFYIFYKLNIFFQVLNWATCQPKEVPSNQQTYGKP